MVRTNTMGFRVTIVYHMCSDWKIYPPLRVPLKF